MEFMKIFVQSAIQLADCLKNIDTKSVPCEWDADGKPTLYTFEHGPNHTYECDYDGMKKVYDRMDNGFRLFGTYYRGLWD